MKKTMKYETPEIEFTRFILEQGIMASLDDGNVVDGSLTDIIPDDDDDDDDPFFGE